MTDKAYIVANKQQEIDVLKKFETKGLVWASGEKPTEGTRSDDDIFDILIGFPYVLIEGVHVSWSLIKQITDENIVYDGRKEEKMYKVTQEFMNELIRWRDQQHLDMENESYYATFKHQDFHSLNGIVMEWQLEEDNPIERNNRLIAIIKWLNGEDVFEVEEPREFVVRSDKYNYIGDYTYVAIRNDMTTTTRILSSATKFNTREEAQEWANSHQVVIEIDEEGNEVE